MRTFPIPRAAVALSLGIAIALNPASGWSIPSERVVFKTGANSTTVRGVLTGPIRRDRDYILNGKAGQTVNVELITDSPEVHYNVLLPGPETALVNTSITGEPKWSGILPADGDYRVRVYLMRGAARRGVTASYKVKFSVLPAQAKP